MDPMGEKSPKLFAENGPHMFAQVLVQSWEPQKHMDPIN